jgi:hypothetical protein
MRLVSLSGLIATTLALGVATAAGAETSAPPGAPPTLQPAQPSELARIKRDEAEAAARFSYNLPRTARYSNGEMDAFAGTPNPAADSIASSDASNGGFDYGDAAVGSAITGGIALLIGAGIVTMRRRRQLRYP